MDKNTLSEQARKLQPVSESCLTAYFQKSDWLIAQINERMAQRPDIDVLIGKNNLNMMRDNHANHVRFMISVFRNFNPDVLLETVLWVFRAYQSHGFSNNYWAAQMNAWIEILKEALPDSCFAEVYAYYEWMQVNIPIFVKLAEAENSEND